MLLYDCVPNLKNFISFNMLLKNVNVLQSGTGKNRTTPLYRETIKPEDIFDETKTIKNKNFFSFH